MAGRSSARAGQAPPLHFVNNAAGDDGGYWGALESAGVERGVARFAGGLVYVVGPLMGGGEDGEVGGLSGGDFAFDA